jgi:hypothetical protein
MGAVVQKGCHAEGRTQVEIEEGELWKTEMVGEAWLLGDSLKNGNSKGRTRIDQMFAWF